MPSIQSIRMLMVSSDIAGERGGLGDLWGVGEVGLLGGRGVVKSSSCSGLLDSICSPRGGESRVSSSMRSLKGRGSGASSMRSESGRGMVETKGEEMVEGGMDIWICLMVTEWGEMGGVL
jgi:hypothetical protein